MTLKSLLGYGGCLCIALNIFTLCKGQKLSEVSKPFCYQSNFEMSFNEYAGTYKRDNLNFLKVWLKDEELKFKPFFWTTTQNLQPISRDTFEVKDHPRLKAYFKRDEKGKVESIEITGYRLEQGVYMKMNSIVPIESILNGDVKRGVEELKKQINDSTFLLDVAETLVRKFATKKKITSEYLRYLKRAYPKNSRVYKLMGDNFIALNNRKLAEQYYRIAYKLNPYDEQVIENLKRLDIIPYSKNESDSSWKLPYSLDALYTLPTSTEINDVRNIWKNRDLSIQDVKEVYRDTVVLQNQEISVRIIAHKIYGYMHYGAILMATKVSLEKLPVILELKGVSPSFFPMDINSGLYAHKFLCDDANKFIYVIPSFRGERIIINGKEFLSEGDHSDSWDGATDDAIAFLNVALSITPQANTERICSFGKSRGGTLALLTGIRDKRIQYVVDLAGPTDWFNSMDEHGWEKKDIVRSGLYNKSNLFETGGQTINWALKKSIDGIEGLKEARIRMIASSPLYFAQDLPMVQLHYGLEDRIVPVINGERLANKLKQTGKKNFEFFIHKNEGHDLDRRITFDNSRRLILSMLD